jgi:HTH-type transcriptional regulator/antitoxin HigA
LEGVNIVPIADKKRARDLPRRFEQLVDMMPPQAIQNDGQYRKTLEVIDRLMVLGKLTQGQSLYLETLVQLVQAYEAEHHRIDTSDLRGIDSLRHLLTENQMNASDLARLLGVHPSMGSKILKGERSLTVDHVRKLAARFKVRPELFID